MSFTRDSHSATGWVGHRCGTASFLQVSSSILLLKKRRKKYQLPKNGHPEGRNNPSALRSGFKPLFFLHGGRKRFACPHRCPTHPVAEWLSRVNDMYSSAHWLTELYMPSGRNRRKDGVRMFLFRAKAIALTTSDALSVHGHS